ncbi:unknown; predicted coding region [Mycoplasmopsis pulmonis]|uniref:Uncharacterized protein n=1 Tax=Mycoplasmopsis pulmonis (strain UAB CTIP) TaxID=272635 RepID=Q98PT3_MYCPU|nr:hypothetical protein [Mycoplasmopsis pulmonis]MDZ7293562.1 hypothetical protein [Mycoplasmopsis pulmonis]CAC13809.1 unknown; predicted coding region [Mycoplasmopsis pulmonis]VEU68398.1 Uncharacterised protein [Mycoplasmopsis pulmonis]
MKLKALFLGPEVQKRKYLPKIIEHLYFLFSSFTSTLVFIGIFVYINSLNQSNFLENFYLSLKSSFFRFLIAILVIVFVFNIILSIRLLRVLTKSENGKMLAILEIFCGLIILFSPLNLFISISSLKFNEIVYQ